MVESDYSELIKRFFKEYCWDEILQLANEFPTKKSLYVDFTHIRNYNRRLSDEFLEAPEFMIKEAERILSEIDLPVNYKLAGAHLRIINVPKVHIRDIRSENLNTLISFDGIVRKITEPRPRFTIAFFKCLRCTHEMKIEQPGTVLITPTICEMDTCGKKGPFVILEDQSIRIDSQKLQVQELPNELKGSQARSIECLIEDDLVDSTYPGDRVTIYGILKSRFITAREGKLTTQEIFVDILAIEKVERTFDEIEISSEEEEEIKELAKDPDVLNRLINSLAPAIFGMEREKTSLVLQLFSGVPKTNPDGSHVRGDIHVLLVGDPSKGKSELMKAAQMRAPRAIFSSGKSATAGGLIAAVVKDDKSEGGRWTVEAGDMVVCDKGLVLIDELDKMRPGDVEALHGAMEQQAVDLSKAGIHVTLSTRTAVCMSANPKYGRFDRFEPLAEQINMPPSLLSRFDLILVVLDSINPAEDEKLAEHVLKTLLAGEIQRQYEKIPGNVSKYELLRASEHASPDIPADLYRKFIAYARKEIFPRLTDEALDHIHKYYLNMRKSASVSKKSVPITLRQLAALVRLAEASARTRLSHEVLLEDAVIATGLMQYCLENIGLDPGSGDIDSSVLNSGYSEAQRTTVKKVKAMLQDLSGRYSQGHVLLNDFYNMAEMKGIPKKKAETYIQKMKERGDLFMRDSEHVKII